MVERLADLGLKPPVGRAPYANRPVVRAGGKEFPDGVPTYALDEPLMLLNLAQPLYKYARFSQS